MRILVALAVLSTLTLGEAGCIAYRAATPSWLGGDPSKDPRVREGRARAIRRRGVIASSVGAVEIALGVLVVVVAATAEASSDEGTVAGGLGDAGKEMLARLVMAAVGGFIAVDGLTSLTCGAIDLLARSTCDREVAALEAADDAADCIACTATSASRSADEARLAAEARAPSPSAAAAPEPETIERVAIVGDFALGDRDGGRVLRLTADGRFRIAADRADLDRDRFEQLGSWRLEGDRLIVTGRQGPCADAEATRVGVYAVAVAQVGLRFTRVADRCPARAALDGQTGWRLARAYGGAVP